MSCEGKLGAACAVLAPPGSELHKVLDGAPTAVLEEIYRVARNRAPALPEGSDARSSLARVKAQAADQAAEDATVALFTHLRDVHHLAASDLPAHGSGRDGVPLPRREAQHGYRAVWEAIQSVEQGGALPALAQQIVTARQSRASGAPASPGTNGADGALASYSRRRGSGTPQVPQISIQVGGQRYTVSGNAGDTFMAVVDALKREFGLNGRNFRKVAQGGGKYNSYWDVPVPLGDVARRLSAAGLSVSDASGKIIASAAPGVPVTSPAPFRPTVPPPLSPLPAGVPSVPPPSSSTASASSGPALVDRFPILRDIANGTVPYAGLLGPAFTSELEQEAHRIAYQMHDPDPDLRAAADSFLADRFKAVLFDPTGAAQGFAQALLTAQGAPRCPSCQQWMDPTRHRCPEFGELPGVAGTRHAKSSGEWVRAVFRSTGVRALTRGIGHATRDRGMQTAAAAARAIVADHLPDDTMPPAVTQAARAFLTAADYASMRDFVTALGVTAALHDAAGRPLTTVAADLYALRPDEVCALANGDIAVFLGVEPVLGGASLLGHHPQAPQAFASAANEYDQNGVADAQAFATVLCGAAGAPKCVRCGQYMSVRRGHRCPPSSAQVPKRRRRAGQVSPTVEDAAKGLTKEQDPINNETIAAMFSRIATSIASQPRRVIFGKPGSGFATDMRGKIYADPLPMGQGAPLQDQLLVINAGIYHELGHEEFTPMGYWADLLDIARSDTPVTRQIDLRFAGLGVIDITLDGARRDVPGCYNIVEDGRMERTISDEYRGVAEVLAASCMIDPRWDEQVGEHIPTRYQLEGALLYTALPYFSVPAATRAGMSEELVRLLDELEPIIARAVRGTAEDAYHASLYLAWRFEQANLQGAPPSSVVNKRPPSDPPPGTQAQRPKIVIDGDQVIDGSQSSGQGGGADVDVEYTGNVTIRNPKQRGEDDDQGTSTATFRKPPKIEYDDEAGGDPRQPKEDDDRGGSGVGRQRKAEDEDEPRAGWRGGGGEDDEQTGERRQRKADDDEEGGGRGRSRKAEDEQEPRRRGGAGDDEDESGEQRQRQEDESGGGGRYQRQQNEQDGGRQRGAGEEGQDGQQSSQSSQSAEGAGGDAVDWSDSAASNGPVRDADQPFDAGDLQAVLDALDGQAATAIDGMVRANARPEVLGAALHQPLGSRTSGAQRYRTEKGTVANADVEFPKGYPGRVGALVPRRSMHQAVAKQLATQLTAIRDETEQRLRRQPAGRLDRGRLVAAIKGQENVRTRLQKYPNTSFAASVTVDMSGSMQGRKESYALYDAVMVLGDTFDALDIPYEVRAFSTGSSAQMKAIGDPSFDPNRAAALTSWGGGGTKMHEVASLATTALGGCEEANKIAISLTDGELQDHERTQTVLEEARRRGVVTFGVFVGSNGLKPQLMDELYGAGNWVAINDLKEMPQQVGKRLATIFKRLRPM